MRTYFDKQTGDYLGSWNYPPTSEQIDHPSIAGHHWVDGQVGGTQYQFNLATQTMKLQAAHAATQYRRDRVYPPIGDQLDAIWKGGAAEAAMLEAVLAVKAKYPKP